MSFDLEARNPAKPRSRCQLARVVITSRTQGSVTARGRDAAMLVCQRFVCHGHDWRWSARVAGRLRPRRRPLLRTGLDAAPSGQALGPGPWPVLWGRCVTTPDRDLGCRRLHGIGGRHCHPPPVRPSPARCPWHGSPDPRADRGTRVQRPSTGVVDRRLVVRACDPGHSRQILGFWSGSCRARRH